MKHFAIPCECGGVYKEFIKCGDDAQYPGRFLYRCPLDASNCSSIWADELFEPQYRKFQRKMREFVDVLEEADTGFTTAPKSPIKKVDNVDSILGQGELPEDQETTQFRTVSEICSHCRCKKTSKKRDKRPKNDSPFYYLKQIDVSLWIDRVAFLLSVIMMLVYLEIILR